MSFAIEGSKRSLAYAIIDLVAYFFASVLIIWLFWKVENILEEQQPFSYSGVVVLFLVFSASYLMIFFRAGNISGLGFTCLTLTSILASLIYSIGTIFVTSLLHSTRELSSIEFGQFLLLVGSLFCLSFFVVAIVRVFFLASRRLIAFVSGTTNID